jgi:hypothetical protein
MFPLPAPAPPLLLRIKLGDSCPTPLPSGRGRGFGRMAPRTSTISPPVTWRGRGRDSAGLRADACLHSCQPGCLESCLHDKAPDEAGFADSRRRSTWTVFAKFRKRSVRTVFKNSVNGHVDRRAGSSWSSWTARCLAERVRVGPRPRRGIRCPGPLGALASPPSGTLAVRVPSPKAAWKHEGRRLGRGARR